MIGQEDSKKKKGNGISKASHITMTKDDFEQRSSFRRKEAKNHTCEKKQHPHSESGSTEEDGLQHLDIKKQAAVAALLYRKGLLNSSSKNDGDTE